MADNKDKKVLNVPALRFPECIFRSIPVHIPVAYKA
mgnify:CR=1 FL=1